VVHEVHHNDRLRRELRRELRRWRDVVNDAIKLLERGDVDGACDLLGAPRKQKY